MGMGSRTLGVAWGGSLAAVGVIGLAIGGGMGYQPEGMGDHGGMMGGAQPEMDEMMEAMMKAGTPNEHHRALDVMAGDWTTEAWFAMAPGAPRDEHEGTAHNEWLMGGRYLGTSYEGKFGGMPFEGHGVMGYDNINGNYFTGWIDSMSTGLLLDKGQMSADGKTLTMGSEMKDPMGNMVKTRSVTRIESKDRHVMEFWHAGPDGEFAKVGEIAFTRR